MKIYYSATQPTSYQLQRQPYAGGAWASDTTQPAAGVLLVSALTFNGTTPGVSYATNHGWTLLTTGAYYYRILPTYSDGTIGQPSLSYLPVAQAAYECVVSGVIGKWDSTLAANVGAQVRATLSSFVAAGSAEYQKTVNPCLVAADGSWTLTVPQSATAEFIFPGGDRPVRVIPASASQAFESLSAPV